MKEKYKEYFNYYAQLEKDFFSTESYVTIEEDNFKTFSVQYNKIYQSICSEIDCILKEICKQVETNSTANKLGSYYKIINSEFKHFKEETVYFNKQKIELQPWKLWEENSATIWWTFYNKIKHHRLEEDKNSKILYYKYANLENVLNALAALYIAEQYYIYSYNYLNEITIPKEYETDPNYKTAEENKAKSKALLINQSIKCSMKRWNDNACYTGFLGQSFFEIEKLYEIMK